MTGPFSKRGSMRLLAGVALLALTACEAGPNLGFLNAGSGAPEVTRASTSTTLVERDVEAPEVFQATEAGLWDGRPSLGGVWVAHPDVPEPERVIIRNEANGKFVIGALFRKERETPGPRIQISSDAADALGVLAGSPTELDVTALRREEVVETPEPEPAVAFDENAEAEPLAAAATIETQALDADPTIQAAAAAIDAAAPNPQPIPDAAPAPEVTPVAAAVAPAPATSSLAKPFIQIGIFSVEDNARRTADNMRKAGIIPTVYDQESRGKKFWRVVVGPMTSEADRAEVLKTVKSLGFSDAYFVTN